MAKSLISKENGNNTRVPLLTCLNYLPFLPKYVLWRGASFTLFPYIMTNLFIKAGNLWIIQIIMPKYYQLHFQNIFLFCLYLYSYYFNLDFDQLFSDDYVLDSLSFSSVFPQILNMFLMKTLFHLLKSSYPIGDEKQLNSKCLAWLIK